MKLDGVCRDSNVVSPCRLPRLLCFSLNVSQRLQLHLRENTRTSNMSRHLCFQFSSPLLMSMDDGSSKHCKCFKRPYDLAVSAGFIATQLLCAPPWLACGRHRGSFWASSGNNGKRGCKMLRERSVLTHLLRFLVLGDTFVHQRMFVIWVVFWPDYGARLFRGGIVHTQDRYKEYEGSE